MRVLVFSANSKDKRVSRKGIAPTLLAGTSLAALLLATPAQAGQTITNQTVATVTNPAGQSTTSIVITGSTVTGAVTNAGTITPGTIAHGGGGNTATALAVINSSVGGGIVNSGVINANVTHGISSHGATITGGIINSGTITLSTNTVDATAINISSGTVSGGVLNSGAINTTVSGMGRAFGISSGANVIGGITNTDLISVNGGQRATDNTVNKAAVPATIAGGIANNGSIAVSDAVIARGISVIDGSTVSGGITNSGKITASSPGGVAIGISLGVTIAGVGAAGQTATISGGVTNSGTITATGGKSGIGIAVNGTTPISGGITNTGTITGNTAAISLKGETGVSNTVTQSAGTILGNIIGSGNANADVLNVTGGQVVLSGGQSISGFGTYNQTGGTLVFNVTQSTAPGTYPTLSAGTINLRGGTLALVPATASLNALAAQHTTVFKNAVAADPPLSGNFASVTTPITLFSASTSPDATTANALDAILSLSPAGLAASAQDLTQDSRLGLDAPRVLTQAVQDRLIANGGALGEGASANALSKGVAGFSFGN
ncbi:MAG: hypothetical protein JO172_10225, partial [Hyphomicrobiales bacterium]|nr:hypothetical protein [Hyphomicrobiales bacterium]